MPQVHNRELMRELGGAVGMTKNSRFMASVNYSDSTRKRITIINNVEQKVHNLKVQVIDRSIRLAVGRNRSLVQKYKDSLRAIEAYQHVVTLNMFPNREFPRDSSEYQAALDRRYTFDALKGKVRQTLTELEPATLRAKEAKCRLDECRNDYARVLRRNLDRIECASALKRQRCKDEIEKEDREKEERLLVEDGKTDETIKKVPFASKKIICRRTIAPLRKEDLDKQFHGMETRMMLGRPFLQREGIKEAYAKYGHRRTPVSRLSGHSRATPNTPHTEHHRSVRHTPGGDTPRPRKGSETDKDARAHEEARTKSRADPEAGEVKDDMSCDSNVKVNPSKGINGPPSQLRSKDTGFSNVDEHSDVTNSNDDVSLVRKYLSKPTRLPPIAVR